MSELIEGVDLPSPHAAFIAGLPKVELHVHHVGSASPRIVADLAKRYPGTVPTDAAELEAFYTFTDFDHFIQAYLATVNLIRTGADIFHLTYEVAREMADQQIRYAELTCTPATSLLAGVPADDYLKAIEDARIAAETDFGVLLRWIFDIPGEIGDNAAELTVQMAVDRHPPGMIGFGLGGPEVGTSRPKFKPQFDRARHAGLHSIPHAGETTGPQTIWDALESLGAERIGHGCTAVQDDQLMDYLVAHQIPLEVCPTSNIRTRSVSSYAEHPLRTFYTAGALVTINSDDPPMFGTTLCREYEIAAGLLNLQVPQIAELARNGVRASFAPEDVKMRILADIDQYLASWV